MTGSPHTTLPRSAPTTLPRSAPATPSSQAEAGSATAASKREEQYNEAKENLDVGAVVTVFGYSVLLGCLFLPKEASNHPGDMCLSLSLLLSFATFLSGKILMLLSLTMLGRDILVSGGHRVAAKCLVAACAALSVLTLLSLLAALLPGGIYRCIGLAVATAIVLAAAATRWYLRRGADEAVTRRGASIRIRKQEELDAASKTAS